MVHIVDETTAGDARVEARPERELEQALRIANRVLDESFRDPDDDISVLARQLTRAVNLNLTPGTYPPSVVRIVARAVWDAQFEDEFDGLNPKGIEHALALQMGRAALDAMRGVAAWITFVADGAPTRQDGTEGSSTI